MRASPTDLCSFLQRVFKHLSFDALVRGRGRCFVFRLGQIAFCAGTHRLRTPSCGTLKRLEVGAFVADACNANKN